MKITFLSIVFLSIGLGFSSCGSDSSKTNSGEKQGKASAYVCPMSCKGSGSEQAGKCPVCGMDYVVKVEEERIRHHLLKEISTPCVQGGEPNLFVSETGQVYLSWVEYLSDTTDALVFSKLESNRWSKPRTIASGSDWFVNWADFPSITAYKDGGQSIAAHWLQKSASGTYDYDVRIAQSTDGGQNWSRSFIPHKDGISAEHGFVSMVPISENKMFITWLDGRNTKGEEHHAGDHGHHGAMSLRAAVFDKKGTLYEETELDNRICDCCQTTAAMTNQGVIVAYRDRSADEVRDISIVRNVNGKWTSPVPVFKDNWLIAGCPVNGPSLKAVGKNVAIAWYSMPDNKPQVKVAFSEDSGATFSSPIRVDGGNPLGRVDIELLSENEALVSWLEKDGEEALIKAVKVNADRISGETFVIAVTSATRRSGFPAMVRTGKEIVFAWTMVDKTTTIKTAKMIMD